MKKSLRMIVCAVMLFVLFANFSLTLASEVTKVSEATVSTDEMSITTVLVNGKGSK